MKRFLKWGGLGLGGVTLLAALALVLAPHLLPDGLIEGEVEAASLAVTGRPLQIKGGVEFSLLPHPQVTIRDLRFPGIEGGTPEMARIEVVEARLAWGSLIFGDIAVRSMRVVAPEVTLERLADGRANWEFAPSEAESPGAPGPEGGGPALSLDLLTIEGGRLRYLDATAGHDHEVEDLAATIRAEDLTAGPFEIEGAGRLRDQPLKFRLETSRLAADHPLRLELDLQKGEMRLRLAGEASGARADARFRLDVTAEGADLARDLALLMAPPAGLLQGAYSLKLELEGDRRAIAVSAMEARLGTLAAKGEGRVTFAPALAVEARLDIGAVDLDTLLAALATEAIPAETTSAPTPFALPSEVVAKLDLGIESIRWHGRTSGRTRLAVELAEGRLSVSGAAFEPPGGGKLAFDLDLAAEAGRPRLDWRLDGAPAAPRAFLAWLGVEAEALPPEAVAKLAIAARGTLSDQEARIADLVVRLDETTFRGTAAAVFTGRPRLEARLEIDVIDLDRYLAAATDSSAPAQTSMPATGENLLAMLDRFDAALDISLGQARRHGQTIEGVRFQGRLVAGAIRVETLEVRDLAGARLSFRGEVADLASGTPRFSVDYSIEVAQAGAIFDLLDVSRPAAGERLGPLELRGSVTVDGEAELAGVTARLAGEVGLAAAPVDVRLRLETRDPRAALRLAGIAAPAGLGPLTASLSAKGNAEAAKVAGELTVAGGALTLEGDLAGLGTAPRAALTVRLDHPKPTALLGLLGLDYRPRAPKRVSPLRLAARIEASGAGIVAREIDLKLGTSALTAEATVTLGPLEADLKVRASRLDLDALRPRDAGKAPSGEGASGVASVPADMVLRLDLAADRVDWNGERITGLVARGGLEQGAVRLDRLAAALPGETQLALQGRQVAGASGPRLEGTVELTAGAPRRLLAWLGVAPAKLPKSRLTKLAVKGRLAGEAGSISIEDLVARLDETTLQGRLQVAFAGRPRVDLELSLDSLDLDAYLPPATAPVKRAKQAAKGTDQAPGAAIGAALAGLAPLAGFDAAIKARAGELVAAGQRLSDVAIDASLRDGTLRLETLRIGAVAGASLAITGTVVGLARAPEVALDYELTAPEGRELVALLAPDLAVDAIGAVALKGRVGLTAAGLRLESKGRLGGVTTSVEAALGLSAGAPVAIEAALRVEDAALTAKRFGITLPADVGAVALSLTGAGTASEAKLEARFAGLGGKADFTGALGGLDATPGLAGELRLTHPSLKGLLPPWVAAYRRRATADPGALALTTRLDVNASRTRLDGLKATLGALAFNAGATFSHDGRAPHVLALAFEDVEVERLLALLPPAEPEPKSPSAAKAPAGLVPGDLTAKLRVTAKSLRWRGRKFTALDLALRAEKGAIHVDKASVKLPGKGQTTLAAKIGEDAGSLRVAGNLNLETRNLRPLLALAEVKLPKTRKRRFGHVKLKTTFVASAGGVHARKLKLRLDDTTITGDLSVELGARPLIVASLHLDRLVVDDYLPAKGKAPAGKTKQDPAAGLAALAAFDARLGLAFGKLVHEGRAVRDARVTAVLDKGRLTIKKLTIADAGSARITLSGSLVDLATTPGIDADYRLETKTAGAFARWLDPSRAKGPEIGALKLSGKASGTLIAMKAQLDADLAGATLALDGEFAREKAGPRYAFDFKLDAANPLPLMRFAGLSPPRGGQALGAVRARGKMRGNAESIRVTGTANLAGATAEIDGMLGLRAGAPLAVRAKIDAPKPQRLLALAGIAAPVNTGPMRLDLVAKGRTEAATLDATIEVAGGVATAKGKVGGLDASPSADLRLTLDHPDPVNLMKTLGLVAPGARAPAPVRHNFSARLVANAKRIRLNDIVLSQGRDRLVGSLTYRASATPPRLNARFKTRRFDLRPLLPDTSKSKRAKRAKRVFPADPLPWKTLRGLDGQIDVEAGQLRVRDLALRNLVARITLRNGDLEVKPLQAMVGGGSVKGFIRLAPKAGGEGLLTVNLKARRVDLRQVFKELDIKEEVRGKLDADIRIRGRGASVAQIMARANGRTEMIVGRGRIDNQLIDVVGADLALGNVGSSEPYTTINCVVSRFQIKSGIATATDLVLDTDRTTIVGEGKVNLRNERLDFGMDMTPKSGAGVEGTGRTTFSLGQLVKPFRLIGTLANPKVGLDPVKSGLALGKAIGGTMLFGPAGIAAVLVGGDTGSAENPCLAAIDQAAKGVAAPSSQGDGGSAVERATGTVEDTVKGLGKAIEGLFKR